MRKLALVTGASRGIGRAVALALAKNGCDLIIHCVSNLERAQQVQQEVAALGVQANIILADLQTTEIPGELLEAAAKADILVLNASVQVRASVENITAEDCAKQLNCNFWASLRLIQACLPHMKTQRWGRIVTIGSVQERKPHPEMLVYSASKAAQTNMVMSLAVQLAADGITVNNVAPGVIYTDRNREVLADPEYARKVTDSIPVGYYGEPEDVAGTVAMLCSQDAHYITGQSIYVDGGKGIL